MTEGTWVYSSPEIYSPIFTPVSRERIKEIAASPQCARLRALARRTALPDSQNGTDNT